MRELEYSQVTLRVVEKSNPKAENEENVIAKLTGETLPTLQRILVCLPDCSPWLKLTASSIILQSLCFDRARGL